MGENDNENIPNFRVVSPAEFAAMRAKMLDHQFMKAEDLQLRVNRFMDELSADDAFTFFQMLHQMTQDTSLPDFYAGQMALMLRRIHNVCTGCGQSHEHHADHNPLSGMSPELDSEDENPFKVISDEVNEVSDDELHKISLMIKYKVHPHVGADGSHAVKCKDCDETFKSLEFRIQQGEECPICAARRHLDNGDQ